MIRLIFIGKTREKYLREGIDEFVRRIGKYTKLEVVEVKNLDTVKITGELAVLDANGRQYSSEEFAEFVKCKDLTFIVGDENGLSEELVKKARHKVSFSRMTFTHEMCRLFLVEQLYRAFTIIKKEKYHR